ncbi:hypothetical protein T484DRAFT_1924739 [Baffinella frigidus]|nr:hypothetical protein T484DRAFT_1924739 [Cryptophyta sp. CCMP2293]
MGSACTSMREADVARADIVGPGPSKPMNKLVPGSGHRVRPQKPPLFNSEIHSHDGNPPQPDSTLPLHVVRGADAAAVSAMDKGGQEAQPILQI